jgi:hypothetical protein
MLDSVIRRCHDHREIYCRSNNEYRFWPTGDHQYTADELRAIAQELDLHNEAVKQKRILSRYEYGHDRDS